MGDSQNNRYTLEVVKGEAVIRDGNDDDFLSVIVAMNRLNRGQRAIYACEAILANLNYLQELWGKEGITDGLAKAVRDALKED